MTVGGDRIEVIEEGGIGAVPAHFVGGNEVTVVGVVLSPVVSVLENLADGAESPGASAVGHEERTIGAVVESPLVGAAVGVNLELVGDGMKAPDSRFDAETFILWCSRFSDQGRVEHSVATVKPAVMTPEERVGGLMGIVGRKAIEQNLRRAVGFVVAIGIGDEEELGSTRGEDTAVTDFESGDEVEIVSEDLVGFEGSIVVLVLKDNEAVFAFAFFLSTWVGVGFGHPDAATGIKGEGDGLPELWLTGNRLDLESFGDMHRRGDVVFFAGRVGFEVPEERAGIQAPGSRRSNGGAGLLLMKTEVVVVDVSPVTGVFVDHADLDHFAEMVFEIDRVEDHVFDFTAAAGFVEDLAGVGIDDFDPGFGMRSGANAEAGPGVGHFEGSRGESALRLIAQPKFITSDPEVAIVCGISPSPGGDGVSFNGAFGPDFSGLGPAVVVPFFKANVGRIGRNDSGQVFLGICLGAFVGRFFRLLLLEGGQSDVPELDLGGAGATVELDGEESGEVSLIGFEIFEGGEVNAVDVDFEAMTPGADEIMIPVVGLGETGQGIRFRKGDGVTFSVGGDFGESSAFGDEGTPVFVVDPPEPKLSVIEVALISGSVARGILLRADLDPGIGGRSSRDAVIKGKIEVGEGAFPIEEFVFREVAALGNGCRDGSIFDPPDFGVSLPLIEAPAIEE